MDLQKKIWTRTNSSGQTHVVTARRDWIDESFVSSALDSEDVYWASATTPSATKLMLDNSLTLGLYLLKPSAERSFSSTVDPARADLTQIGITRLVTDQVTIVHLVDVIVAPEHQGKGLGEFLMECLKELVEDMKTHGAWRRMVLIADQGSRVERFYKRVLDVETAEDMSHATHVTFLTTKRRMH